MPPRVEATLDELEVPHDGTVDTPVVQRELSGRLAGLSLPRQVLVLAIWPLFEQFLSFLVGTVDMALAGRLKPEAMSMLATDALGLAAYIQWLLAVIYSSVGVGAGALIARAVGARHRRIANAAIGQALLMGVILGLLAGTALWISAPAITELAGLRGQAADLAVTYLRIICLTTPAAALLLIGNAALRAAGDTRTPFAIMLLVNAVNVLTSVTLVFGPGRLGGHGVAGIATGTAVAWAVGCAAILFALTRGLGGVRLRLIRLRPHLHTARRIARVGLPNLAEAFFGMWLGNFIVLRMVAGLDSGNPGIVGAHMIAIRIESMSFLAGFAFATASATLAGQYLGLGDPQRARRAVVIAWSFATAIMGLLGLCFAIAPEPFVAVITSSERLTALASPLLRICGPIQVFFATSIVFASTLRGTGDTRTTFKLTAVSIFLVRLPLAYALGVVLGYGLTGVWFGLCGELIVRAAMFTARFLHGGWTKVEV